MGRHSKVTEAEAQENPQELRKQLDTLLTANIRDIVEQAVETQKRLDAALEKEAQQAEKEKQERIAAQKKAARFQQAREIVPTNSDKEIAKDIQAITKKLKVEILIHNTVPKAGPGDLLASSFGAAREIYSLLRETNVGPQVAAYYFGATLTKNDLPVAALDEAENYKTAKGSGNDFTAAAEHIRKDSESAQERGKIYIVLTDGNIGGNTAQLAYTLEALKLNPAASVNFVVVNKEEEIKLNQLLEALKDTPASKRIRVTRAADADKTLAGAKQAIRTHVSSLNADVLEKHLRLRAQKDAMKAGPRIRPEGPSATRAMAQQFQKRSKLQRALFGHKEEVPTPKGPAAASPKPQ